MAVAQPANIDIAAALAEAEELYRARNPKSLAQHQTACEAMPGGNTRSAIHVDPFPLTMVRGEGARLWDLDGHDYVGLLCLRQALSGGHSRVISFHSAHNALLVRHPNELPRLTSPSGSTGSANFTRAKARCSPRRSLKA